MASPSSSRNPDATKIALPKAKRATVACTACRKRQVRCQKAPAGSDCLRCQRMNIPCQYIPLNVQRQAWEEQQRDALLRDLVTSPPREVTTVDPPAAELSRISRAASSYPAAGIAPASGTSPTDRADFAGMGQRTHMPTNYPDRWIASPPVRPDARYSDQVQTARSSYVTEPDAQHWPSHIHTQTEPLRRHATPVSSGAGTLPSHPDAQSAYPRNYGSHAIPTAPTSLPRLQTIMPPTGDYGRGYSTSPVTSVASSAGWSERSATPNVMSADRYARAPSPWTSSSDPRTASPWPVNAQTRWQNIPSTTPASAGAIPSNPNDAQYYSQVPIWQYSSRSADAAQTNPNMSQTAPTTPYDIGSRPPVPNDWTDATQHQYRQ